ncbi:hypothetical protein EGR_06261 [Echinococcus granulosus]|uniref:Uncharacterized protein n=1 Tax=Echinococcus granulosus TaxID=6210 RepID=W6UL58_ECHGR|nr:hypothetical protein EGR_06261 [Echinococcus granulosus]EUB58837.1 hypothetical protein EGR_06261 [Echinococcus granulosus]
MYRSNRNPKVSTLMSTMDMTAPNLMPIFIFVLNLVEMIDFEEQSLKIAGRIKVIFAPNKCVGSVLLMRTVLLIKGGRKSASLTSNPILERGNQLQNFFLLAVKDKPAFANVIHLKWTKEATYRFFWPHSPILQVMPENVIFWELVGAHNFKSFPHSTSLREVGVQNELLEKNYHLLFHKKEIYRPFEFLEPTHHGLLVPQWSENGHMDLQKFKTEDSKKNSNYFTAKLLFVQKYQIILAQKIVSNGFETTRLLNKSKINDCNLFFPKCTIHILLRSFVGDIKRNPHLFVLQVRHNREILEKNFSGDIYITFTVLPSVKCPIYYVTLKLQKMKNSYLIISHESGGDT